MDSSRLPAAYYPIYPPVPLYRSPSSSERFAEKECHRRPPPLLGPEDLARARVDDDDDDGGGKGFGRRRGGGGPRVPSNGEGGELYSTAYSLSSPHRSKRADAAGAGGYAAQHSSKHQQHHGGVASPGRGGELGGYAEFLSAGASASVRGLGSELQEGGGATLLRPSRYSTYQERRPFY